ncbi:MAG: LacI family DNA-binding transcriptional regulator [Pseudomonadota bacterium]
MPASYRDIAARAGVSVATVSRALSNSAPVSEALRRRVLDEAERLRREESSARTGSQATALSRIGLVYPGDPINAEYGGFDAAIMSGVNRGAFERRFDVATINVVEDKLEPSRTPSSSAARASTRSSCGRSRVGVTSVSASRMRSSRALSSPTGSITRA